MDAEPTVRADYGALRPGLSEQTATPWRFLGVYVSALEASG